MENDRVENLTRNGWKVKLVKEKNIIFNSKCGFLIINNTIIYKIYRKPSLYVYYV